MLASELCTCKPKLVLFNSFNKGLDFPCHSLCYKLWVKWALKHLLIVQSDRPLSLWTNQDIHQSLWVQDGVQSGWTTHVLTHCAEISWHGSVWSWRDDFVMGPVKRLSGVAGFGPSTVLFAFLRGKLSNIISARSDRGPWSHKGLAVLASPRPGLITFCWRGKANFRSA